MTVKLSKSGYLMDGVKHVPLCEGNIDYQEVKEWIDQGNIPEPEFTEEELAKIELAKKIQEAKQYLIATDFKVLPDYDKQDDEIIRLRQEAREFIRSKL